MRQRYLLACVLIMALSLGTGYAGWALTRVDYRSSCLVQISLPLVEATGQDYFDASTLMTATELELATAAGAFSAAGRDVGMDPSVASAEIQATQQTGRNYVLVQVNDSDQQRSTRLANAACNRIVGQVSSQRSADQTSEATGLRKQLDALQSQIDQVNAIPFTKQSVAQQVILQGDQTAVATGLLELASALAGAPDSIVVLARAGTATRADSRSLTRNLVVGGVIGLLICIALVLVSETLIQRRQPPKSPA